jgi:hypothetical protein
MIKTPRLKNNEAGGYTGYRVVRKNNSNQKTTLQEDQVKNTDV